ncbi:hypothetical protein ACFQX7_39905 [Luedemannella flava]
MSVIDDYLAGLDADARAAFERVRDVALEEAPTHSRARATAWPR